jgi:hypothetical protein
MSTNLQETMRTFDLQHSYLPARAKHISQPSLAYSECNISTHCTIHTHFTTRAGACACALCCEVYDHRFATSIHCICSPTLVFDEASAQSVHRCLAALLLSREQAMSRGCAAKSHSCCQSRFQERTRSCGTTECAQQLLTR